MVNKPFYEQLYAVIGELTPLKSDCGRLCGGACCAVGDDQPGMYLFPGEEAVYAGLSGFALRGAHLPGYGAIQLLDCGGACGRSLRPLSCRIFPLAPKVHYDTVNARLDPRGRPVCPLCHQGRGALSSAFVAAVQAVFAELLREPQTADFLRALSREIDAFEQSPL